MRTSLLRNLDGVDLWPAVTGSEEVRVELYAEEITPRNLVNAFALATKDRMVIARKGRFRCLALEGMGNPQRSLSCDDAEFERIIARSRTYRASAAEARRKIAKVPLEILDQKDKEALRSLGYIK